MNCLLFCWRQISSPSIDSFLFKDRAILQMIGFNGVHFEKGFSRRNKGGHLRFNVSTLGKLMGDFSLSQTNELFRNSLQLLSKKKFVPKGVFAADATPLYVSYSSRKFCKSFTPLLAIYFYRKRHHTENEGYRELKQGYKIGKFPSQTFSGVSFHIIFTLLIYNFITCYKTKKGGKAVSL